MPTRANVNETLTSQDISRLSADIQAASKKARLLTVGFTIRNCAKMIGESLGDRGVLGWFVHMPTVAENTTQKLTFSKLLIRKEGGVYRLGAAQMEDPQGRSLAQFKVFAQNPVPTFPAGNSTAQNAASTYVQSKEYTAGQLHPSPSAQVKDLSHYTNWSGACFFRRSDLKFMQLLLLAQPDKYNDLFFTGSKVRYDIMHNPSLRVEQFTSQDANGAIIPDPSQAFTMKAEPVMNPDQFVPSGNTMINLLGATNNTSHSQSGRTSGREMSPGAVMAAPCPPYWDVVEEIGNNLNLNSTEGSEKLFEILSDIEDLATTLGVEGQEILLSEVLNGEDRGLSYEILTYLINLLTQLRDGGRS